jgi:hypothetical protein
MSVVKLFFLILVPSLLTPSTYSELSSISPNTSKSHFISTASVSDNSSLLSLKTETEETEQTDTPLCNPNSFNDAVVAPSVPHFVSFELSPIHEHILKYLSLLSISPPLFT